MAHWTRILTTEEATVQTRFLSISMALAMTMGSPAWADDDTAAGSSVRPPASAAGGSEVSETAVPREKRETEAGLDLPGDSVDRVQDQRGPHRTGAGEVEATKTGLEDGRHAEEAAAERQATRTDEHEAAVARYIESMKDKQAANPEGAEAK